MRERMARPKFTKTVIAQIVNNVPPEPMNLLFAAGDINGDGRPDLVVSGRNGRMVWLENPGREGGWAEHLVDDSVEKLERGGLLYDLTGNGLSDIVNGGDWRSDEVFWWENPGASGGRWTRRLIARTSRNQVHDLIVGDLTGDGPSLFFTNQIGGTDIYRVPIPPNPRISPWPHLERIASSKSETNPYAGGGRQPEEGLAIGDVDGDGAPELVCGTHWYKYVEGGWQCYKFTDGYITTKVAVGDLDGDGRNEIVLAEGDPCVYGKLEGGKLAWFKRGQDATERWAEHVLADGLLDAHSLQLGEVCGSGRLDIVTGEVGYSRRPGRLGRLFRGYERSRSTYAIRPPSLLLFENEGNGRFTRHVLDEGTGIHDGLLVDLFGRGVPDIVGKPLHGPERWSIHAWLHGGRETPAGELRGGARRFA
jgi:hypothetical protein